MVSRRGRARRIGAFVLATLTIASVLSACGSGRHRAGDQLLHAGHRRGHLHRGRSAMHRTTRRPVHHPAREPAQGPRRAASAAGPAAERPRPRPGRDGAGRGVDRGVRRGRLGAAAVRRPGGAGRGRRHRRHPAGPARDGALETQAVRRTRDDQYPIALVPNGFGKPTAGDLGRHGGRGRQVARRGPARLDRRAGQRGRGPGGVVQHAAGERGRSGALRGRPPGHADRHARAPGRHRQRAADPQVGGHRARGRSVDHPDRRGHRAVGGRTGQGRARSQLALCAGVPAGERGEGRCALPAAQPGSGAGRQPQRRRDVRAQRRAIPHRLRRQPEGLRLRALPRGVAGPAGQGDDRRAEPGGGQHHPPPRGGVRSGALPAQPAESEVRIDRRRPARGADLAVFRPAISGQVSDVHRDPPAAHRCGRASGNAGLSSVVAAAVGGAEPDHPRSTRSARPTSSPRRPRRPSTGRGCCRDRDGLRIAGSLRRAARAHSKPAVGTATCLRAGRAGGDSDAGGDGVSDRLRGVA